MDKCCGRRIIVPVRLPELETQSCFLRSVEPDLLLLLADSSPQSFLLIESGFTELIFNPPATLPRQQPQQNDLA